MDIDEIRKIINEIAIEKGWYDSDTKKPQFPKNIAISISLEAAELLECFQWSDKADKEKVAEELADIIIFCSQLANLMEINLSESISKKLKINQDRTWNDE